MQHLDSKQGPLQTGGRAWTLRLPALTGITTHSVNIYGTVQMNPSYNQSTTPNYPAHGTPIEA